ncbi:MAG: XylR N-terminal domain-containing protein [Bacillaceae bacterium]|nr:XylR N-terminal domain-containing protein [Bacillaceae bacterium]
MKASELTLTNFLNYYQQDVESFLKEQNMMITSIDAWGVLRKDLISTLGVERAKRFLLRYGRHCGRVEARMLKEMFDWQDDLEWLLAGTRMHKVTGRTFSNLIKFDADIEEKRFDVEGYWIDSSEAKLHVKHFSYYHEPICFFLVGWAGGYTSECLGKPIYFKEVECLGKGDPHCRYIGKTLDQWGDEIKEDLIDYEQDLADELDRVYRRVEKQKEALKRGTAVSQKLTRALLQGKGLNNFAGMISDEFRCPVVIENRQFDRLASHGRFLDQEKDITIQEIIKTPRFQVEREKLIQEQRTVKFQLEQNGDIIYLLVSPIVIRKQIYGYISLARKNVGFDAYDEDILDRIAMVCAVQMLNEQTVVETEQRLKGEMLEELFSEKGDTDRVSSKLASLGYNLKTPHYVLVFEILASSGFGGEPNMAVQDEDRYLEVRTKVTERLRKAVEDTGYRALISTKLNYIHTIISREMLKKTGMDIKDFAEEFVAWMRKEYDSPHLKLFIGVSSLCEDHRQFYNRFQEAKRAIEMNKLKTRESSVILASELGYMTLLLNARSPEELERFAHEKLGPLLEYDRESHSEFLNTLYHYMECECNLYKTAREINVSISGMRYRIKRIQELLNIDLNRASTRFEIQLALEILRAYDKLDI